MTRPAARRRRRVMAGLGALVLAIAGSGLTVTPAQAAGTQHAAITGSGSSWAANAIAQWVKDVSDEGDQVGFSSEGSAQGRQDFASSTTDFGVSDIGYQGTDPATGVADSSSRPYAYLPIVAGGTSFPYHIDVAGKLVQNLRLSGLTLAKIFTNQITNWDDPAITADNGGAGHALPSLPIIPVVHQEGSGSTYQFTAYLNQEYPSLWHTFAPGPTEYFPRQNPQVAENGSDGVINFVSSKAGDGAIAFDEYSYALNAGYPVAKILNSAGYYTLPTQYNVAVALTKAIINTDKSSPDYLLENLNNVYTYNDPRVYPLSSYSYMIMPTGTNAQDGRMTTGKRQTLADLISWSICQGQGEVGQEGYSALPVYLVQAGFQQMALLNKADPAVDVTAASVATCNNPTFIAGQPNNNHLAQIAPLPPACDDQTSAPCTGSGFTGTTGLTGSSGSGGGSGGGGTSSGGGSSGGGGSGGGGSGGGGSGGGGSGGGSGPTAAAGGATTTTKSGAPLVVLTGPAGAKQTVAAGSTYIDPVTGNLVTAGAPSPTPTPSAAPTNLVASQSASVKPLVGGVVGFGFLLLLAVPAVVSTVLRRRGRQR